MAKRFKKSTQDDFGGMLGIAAQLENGNTAKVISRFAENINDENHDAIQNFDRMNMALSKVYATVNENSERIYWSADDMTENSNTSRGQHDRYIWAGEFKKDAATKKTVFKGTSIDDDSSTTTNTDGMMMIPSPYFNFRPNAYTWSGASALAYIGGAGHYFSHTTQQEAIRITIKSAKAGGLDQRTFIPLFGYVKGHFDATRGPFVNVSGRYYRPGVLRSFKVNDAKSAYNSPTHFSDMTANHGHLAQFKKYADIPCAIAGNATTNNLYKKSIDSGKQDVNSGMHTETNAGWHHRFSSEFHRNTIIWFMYAWERIGNVDKGMIITTAGEAPCSTHRHETVQGKTTDYKWYGSDGCYRHRPTNAHYGNKDGFFKWEAPYEIRDILASGGLQDVYNYYNSPSYLTDKNQYDTDSDTDDPRRAFLNHMPYIHTHFKDAHSETLGGYPNGYKPNEADGDGVDHGKKYEKWDAVKSGSHYAYDLGMALGYAYYPASARNQVGYHNVQDWDYPNHAMNVNMNWAPSHIVSFGEIVANADLQDPEEILIDANTIAAAMDDFEAGIDTQPNTLGNRYSGDLYKIINSPLLGLNARSNYRFESSDYTSWNNSQLRYNTAAGPSTEYRARAGSAIQILYSGSFLGLNFRDVPGQYWNDWAKPFFNTSYHNWDSQAAGANAIALRPVHDQGIEIHGFSFASYEQDILDDSNLADKKTIAQRIEGGGVFKYYFRSSDDTTYTFTSSGHSYDPLLEAKSDPLRLSNDTDWTDSAHLIDGDVSTRAQIDAAGEDKALYIALSDSEETIATPADFDVQSFSIGVRGVTLAANTNHKLRFSVVSDTNNDTSTDTFFTTTSSDGTVYSDDKQDIGDVPMNNNSISPAGDGMYLIKFKSTSGSPVDYSQIQNAFLKIWAEEVS